MVHILMNKQLFFLFMKDAIKRNLMANWRISQGQEATKCQESRVTSRKCIISCGGLCALQYHWMVKTLLALNVLQAEYSDVQEHGTCKQSDGEVLCS